MKERAQIAVLMATYNGALFLKEQVESILAQTHSDWCLTVSDDGSTDATLDIVRRYQKVNLGRITLVQGPHQDFAANFLSLAMNAKRDVDYYAWSDQDDVWLPDKLERAVKAMMPLGQDEPALYCGRTVLVDVDNREYGLSPMMDRLPPSFANALVQCLGGGNTMVFNRPARALIAGGYGHKVPSHDWWAYMIVSGSGGRVIYDPTPILRYRQTGNNAMGSNRGFKAKVARLKAVAKGVFREWTSRNLSALAGNEGSLTPENRRILAAMASLHRGDGNVLQRLKCLRDGGLYRQSPLQSAFLYAMATVGWM